jgi:hypothetical protein
MRVVHIIAPMRVAAAVCVWEPGHWEAGERGTYLIQPLSIHTPFLQLSLREA